MKAILALGLTGALALSVAAQEFATAGGTARTPHAASSGNWVFGSACYQYDDGSTEDSLGLTNGGDMAWLQHFDPAGGCETITAVMTAIGWSGGAGEDVLIGEDLDVFVWDDPNNDGNPTDAVLLGQGTALVTSANDDVFQVIQLDTPVNVTSRFFIGANVVNPAGTFPAPLDESQLSNGRAWVSGVPGGGAGSFDPNDLNAGTGVNEMDAIGFPSVFLVRATAGSGDECDPCDMDCDGVVSAFDIEPFLGLIFDGDAPCNTCTGDANDDGNVDAFDIEPFLNCLFP